MFKCDLSKMLSNFNTNGVLNERIGESVRGGRKAINRGLGNIALLGNILHRAGTSSLPYNMD